MMNQKEIKTKIPYFKWKIYINIQQRFKIQNEKSYIYHKINKQSFKIIIGRMKIKLTLRKLQQKYAMNAHAFCKTS